MKKPKKLSDLRIAEVSLVEVPANLRKFLITKGITMGDTIEQVIDTPFEGEKDVLTTLLKKGLHKDAIEAIIGVYRITKGYSDILPEDVQDLLYKACRGLSDEEKKFKTIAENTKKGEIMEPTEEEKKKMEEEAKKAAIIPIMPTEEDKKKAATDLPPTGTPPKPDTEKKEQTYGYPPPPMKKEGEGMEEDALLKGIDMEKVPKEVRDAFAIIAKDARDAKEVIRKMQEAELKRVFVTKAAEIPMVPVSTEELGIILKSIADVDKGLEVKVFNILKAMSSMIESGKTFETSGRYGPGETDAWGAIEKAASALVEKSADGLTREQAIARVLEEQPSLYNEWKSRGKR